MPQLPGPASIDPLELAVLIAICAAVAGAVMWFRFPGGPLFGAMLASAVLHGTGLIEARLPNWLLIVTMVALGAMTGSRFTGTDGRALLRTLGAGLGSFAVSAAVAAGFVALLTGLVAIRVADAAVAFAPGALDAMMILALTLHLDPVYVGAHHVARFFIASLALPVLVRMFDDGAAPPATDSGPAKAPVREPLERED
jgi:hypothetical protein